MTRLAAAATLGIALALAAVSFAAAQGPDVRISQPNFDCTGDPEIVILENTGDATQVLTGWELRSDPEASEVFDLSVPVSLLAGAAVTIRSGPSASGAFIWSTNEVFRDNDSTDYVRLVDDTGAAVDEVACAEEATPTPTPEPSPVGEVPNGGGPPPPAADILSPGVMLLIGGSLAAAGVGAIALPWLRLRSSPAVASPSSRSRSAAGRSARRLRGGHGTFGYSTVSLAAIALVAVMVVHLLRGPSD